MSKLKAVGTPCYHCGHGRGLIIGYNGQEAADVDKQFEQLKAVSDENNLNEQYTNQLAGVVCKAVAQGVYSSDRYPYIIRYEPSEKWPDGFKECYGEDEVHWGSTDEVYKIVREMAQCNGFDIKKPEEWPDEIDGHFLPQLEFQATRLPEDLIDEFVDGEEEMVELIVEEYGLYSLHTFLNSVFDGPLHEELKA